MNTIKDEKLKEKRERVAKYGKTLTALGELEGKLLTHTGKLVDKRFFLEHFKVSNEYRDWTKYEIRAPRYEWSKHTNELYISQECTLELMSRETAHIIEVIRIEREKISSWIEETEHSIEKLEALDADALTAEIIALFDKYGQPEIWGKILDSYEVKYPKEDK